MDNGLLGLEDYQVQVCYLVEEYIVTSSKIMLKVMAGQSQLLVPCTNSSVAAIKKQDFPLSLFMSSAYCKHRLAGPLLVGTS